MPKRVIRFLTAFDHVGRGAYLFLVIMAAVSIAVLAGWIHHETSDRINAEQQSRIDITYETCQNQNNRHNITLARLDQLLNRNIAKVEKQVKKGVLSQKEAIPRIQQIKASRGPTVFLLEAVIPHTDCRDLIIQRFGKDARPND